MARRKKSGAGGGSSRRAGSTKKTATKVKSRLKKLGGKLKKAGKIAGRVWLAGATAGGSEVARAGIKAGKKAIKKRKAKKAAGLAGKAKRKKAAKKRVEKRRLNKARRELKRKQRRADDDEPLFQNIPEEPEEETTDEETPEEETTDEETPEEETTDEETPEEETTDEETPEEETTDEETGASYMLENVSGKRKKRKAKRKAKKAKRQAKRKTRKAARKEKNKGSTLLGRKLMAPLLPFKGLMKKQLIKRGIKPLNRIDAIAKQFYKAIVEPKNFEEFIGLVENFEFAEAKEATGAKIQAGGAVGLGIEIVKAIVSFFKAVKEKGDSGEELSPAEESIYKGVKKVDDQVTPVKKAIVKEAAKDTVNTVLLSPLTWVALFAIIVVLSSKVFK